MSTYRNIIESSKIKEDILFYVNLHKKINITELAIIMKKSKTTVSKYAKELNDDFYIFGLLHGKDFICFPNNYEGLCDWLRTDALYWRDILKKNKTIKNLQKNLPNFNQWLNDKHIEEFIIENVPKREKYDKEFFEEFINKARLVLSKLQL